MNEHHTDKSSMCFLKVRPVYMEFAERLRWGSLWWRSRYLALDLGLGAVLTLCRLWSLELGSYRFHTYVMEAHGTWMTQAEVPQPGVAFRGCPGLS